MAIQPPYLKQPSHVAKATLTCGLYPATRVSPNMWLSSHQMYLKFNREINRKINREINRNLSVFQGKMLFKNQSEIQSLNFQRKQNLLKKSCFQSKIDFAKKSIVLSIFFNRGAFGSEGRNDKELTWIAEVEDWLRHEGIDYILHRRRPIPLRPDQYYPPHGGKEDKSLW